MPDETIETIEDAIDEVARGMLSSTTDANGRELTFIPLRDLIAADQHLANKRASAKAHFGMRMTKAIPPGGG